MVVNSSVSPRLAALIVLGLSGLAVTQPLLDLVGSNAEFFVAGNYSPSQIVTFALVVAVAPPLVGILVVVGAAFVDRRAGSVALAVVTAVFAAGLVLAVLRSLGVDALWLVAALAIGLALTAGWLVWRFRVARMFAAYLSVANLLFVGTFLFLSQSSALVVGSGATDEVGDVSVPDLDGPVVMIILDELPAATIMEGDGTINEERYPGFARLAGVSTWFRNASSRANWTPAGVPAILTGIAIAEEVPPTYDNFPRNLFTLLGNDVPIHRVEPITDLCPDVLCPERERAAIEPGALRRLDRLRPSGAAKRARAITSHRSITRGVPTAPSRTVTSAPVTTTTPRTRSTPSPAIRWMSC